MTPLNNKFGGVIFHPIRLAVGQRFQTLSRMIIGLFRVGKFSIFSTFPTLGGYSLVSRSCAQLCLDCIRWPCTLSTKAAYFRGPWWLKGWLSNQKCSLALCYLQYLIGRKPFRKLRVDWASFSNQSKIRPATPQPTRIFSKHFKCLLLFRI